MSAYYQIALSLTPTVYLLFFCLFALFSPCVSELLSHLLFLDLHIFFFLTFSVTNSETWEFLRVRDERETESCERETEIREWDLWPSEKWCQENGVCIGFRPEIRTGPKQKNKKEKKQKLLGFRSYNTSFSVTYWLAHVAVVVFVTTLLVVLVTHFSDLLHLFLLLSQTIKRFFLLSFFVVPFSISV